MYLSLRGLKSNDVKRMLTTKKIRFFPKFFILQQQILFYLKLRIAALKHVLKIQDSHSEFFSILTNRKFWLFILIVEFSLQKNVFCTAYEKWYNSKKCGVNDSFRKWKVQFIYEIVYVAIICIYFVIRAYLTVALRCQ